MTRGWGNVALLYSQRGKGNIQSVRSLFPFFATHTLSKGRKGGGGGGGGGGEALHPPSFSPKFIHARPANGRLIHKGQQMALPLPSLFPRREGAPPSPPPQPYYSISLSVEGAVSSRFLLQVKGGGEKKSTWLGGGIAKLLQQIYSV